MRALREQHPSLACGLNPKASINLYKKLSYQLYYTAANNFKRCDIDELNKFQRMVVKKIQGFHEYVRTDMCESMVGIMRLSLEIKRRKLSRDMTKPTK